jgi:hypothetical protein
MKTDENFVTRNPDHQAEEELINPDDIMFNFE